MRPAPTGTTNGIDQTLIDELPQKATTPPMALPFFMKMSGSLTFSPQVPRYIPGQAPKQGYYYDVPDYTVAAMQVPGGSITVLPGTAIGLRFDWFIGFGLWGAVDFHRSRHGEMLRLVQELVISGLAAAACYAAGRHALAIALATLSIVYHALVYASGASLLTPHDTAASTVSIAR